nr:uncharacterized protein LOC119165626 isoform X2 [Rhipicephalus microplus]
MSWSELGERSFSSGHGSYRLKGIDRIDAQMVNIPALLQVRAAPDMVNKVGAVLILTCLARCLLGECSGTASQDTSSERCAPRPESYSIDNRASCTFTRIIDIDSRRIPPEIASVKCKCPGSICSDGGDFRCHEVKQTVKVSYPRNGACGSRSATLVNKTLEVTTACVCASSRSLSAAEDGLSRTLFHPSTHKVSRSTFGR